MLLCQLLLTRALPFGLMIGEVTRSHGEGSDDDVWRRVWLWERRGRKGSTYCLRWHDDRGRIRTESLGRDRKLVKQLRHKRELSSTLANFGA